MTDPRSGPTLSARDTGEPEPELPAAALAELLAPEFDAASVPSLQQAQAGMPYFALLRDLVRLGEAHFAVRMAVLTELASSDRTRWDTDAIARHFAWLLPEARAAVLRSLRKGGWLEVVDAQVRLTDRGEALYAIVGRVLGIQPEAGDLALGVLNVELSRDLGQEATPALKHLHHNLRRIVDDAEGSVRSHSEVRVLEARDRIDRNLAWARRARACVESLDLADDACYRAAQSVGAALGELHQWQAVLQRAIGDLQQKRIQLGSSGLSMTDVTGFLMRCDVDELADFGRPLVSVPVQPLFLILDNALSEAEYEWLHGPDRQDTPDLQGWTNGPPEHSAAGALELPEFGALDRFVADIQALVQKGGVQKLSSFVPRRSWAESAWRLSVLALGESLVPVVRPGRADASEMAAHEERQDATHQALLHALGGTPFEVAVAGDGADRDKVWVEFASEVSRGVIRLYEGGAASGVVEVGGVGRSAVSDAAGP